jgi:hypothetical protein
MSCEDQGHVKVLAGTLGAAADSLDEVATDDETRAKLWDGLNATQRKALDELVACGKRRERPPQHVLLALDAQITGGQMGVEADDAPPPKKARKEPAPAAEPALAQSAELPAKPLEQAARDRDLSARDRLQIIGAQLRANGASPPASAEAWDGLLARLQEVDRIYAGDPVLRAQLASTGLCQLVKRVLPSLRNSEGKFFLRLSQNDPMNQFKEGYRDYEVELMQPTQPSTVETAVAELARDLVEKYNQWRAHRREKCRLHPRPY